MKKGSIKISKYEGWMASILIHGILSLIFLFIVYDKPIDLSEYANLTFSSFNPVNLPVVEENILDDSPPTPSVVSSPRSTQPRSAPTSQPKRKVDLPSRRMTEHDVNRIPVENQGHLTRSENADIIDVEREAIHGVNDNLSSLDENILNATKPGTKPSEQSIGQKVDAVAIPGQKGGDVQFEKPYEISWEGVVRDVLYDPLPEYPPGLDQEARIRIRITVLPNGTVGDLIPLQKADATLESETIKTLKLWKLSALKPTDPQVNQTAVITFRFVLE